MKGLFILCTMMAGAITVSAQGQQHHLVMSGQIPQPVSDHMQHHMPKLPSAAERLAQVQNGTVQLRDSMYYYSDGSLSYKYEYAYDSYGQLMRETGYSYLGMDTWQLESEGRFTYDENHRLAYYVYCRTDYSTRELLPESKQEYTYNDRGMETGYITYRMYDGNWVYSDKSEQFFDDNDRIIGVAYSIWMDEAWRLHYQNETTCDALGRETCYWYKNYNLQLGIVDNGTKNVQSWDSYGNQTLLETYNWDSEQDQWVGSSKSEYVYDSDGNQTAYASYNWDGGQNQWVPAYTSSGTYDAYGHRTSYLVYVWHNGELELSSEERIENTYDADGRLIVEISYMKDLYSGSWNENYKTEYAYESHGNVVSQAYYYWDRDNSDWVLNSLSEMTYDDQGRRLGNAYYRITNGVKVGESKTEFAYDAMGHEIFFAYYRWSKGEWTVQYKYEYTYDSEGRQTGNASYGLDIVGNDPYALSVNLSDDAIAGYLDEQGLLFTGEGYALNGLYVDQFVSGHETLGYVPVWKNNGLFDDPSWSSIYLFNSVENAKGNEIAKLSAEDWEIIKHGDFKADFSVINNYKFDIYVTTGWWSTLWTGSTIPLNSDLITGGPVYEMRGYDKYEHAFDEYGNEISTYYYIWRAGDWVVHQSYIYYYSAHTAEDIRQIIEELRPRVSKQMRNGQVFVVVGDKTYDMNGREVTR